MAAELTSRTNFPIIPVGGGAVLWKSLIWVSGTAAASNDFITVPGLIVIQGAYLISSTGVVGTMTFSGNVITITNASTLNWSGIVWGA